MPLPKVIGFYLKSITQQMEDEVVEAVRSTDYSWPQYLEEDLKNPKKLN